MDTKNIKKSKDVSTIKTRLSLGGVSGREGSAKGAPGADRALFFGLGGVARAFVMIHEATRSSSLCFSVCAQVGERSKGR